MPPTTKAAKCLTVWSKRPCIVIKIEFTLHIITRLHQIIISNKMVKKSLKLGIAALAVFAIALGIGVGISEKNKRSRSASSSLATGLSEYEAYESIDCIDDAIDTANGKSGKSGPTSPSEGKSGKSGPTSPSAGKSGKSGSDPRRILIVPGTEDYQHKPANRRLTGKSNKAPSSKAAKVSIDAVFTLLLYQDFHVSNIV